MQAHEIAGYAGALLTGLTLGLLGGGGALLSIPVLVYLFRIEPARATGYSLFLVALTSTLGAVQNIRRKCVDYTAVVYYGIPSAIAIFIMRRFVIPALPQVIFEYGGYQLDKNHLILFALVMAMLFAAYKMITDREPTTAPINKENHVVLIVYAIVLGSFLGLVGAGGGFLMVPALIYFAGLSPKKAIGTSLVLIAINSSIGFLGDINMLQHANYQFLFMFSAFSITGVITGHYLGKFIESNKLKTYFGWFILLLALSIIIKEGF